MKKSIILFFAAVTVPAFKITMHADKPVAENGMAFENGSFGDYYYDLNVPAKQGHVSGRLG